jgi:signal transduction histidine kinase
MRLDTALWRAIAVYRLAALLYATGSMLAYTDTYARPALGWAVLAAMAVWTALTAYLYADPRRRGWPLLVLDLGLVMSAVLSSVLVQTPERIAMGDPTVPVSWAAAPVAAWGVARGWPGGALAATGISSAAVIARGDPSQATVNSVVLLLLLGTVVGYVVSLARRAESAYAKAVQLQAATAERERLSRSVHDGVLQALALFSRRATDPELAGLAAEQEAALRRLVSGPPPSLEAGAVAGPTDLRALLPSGADLHLAAPADPVLLPGPVARELAAAAAAAVDNARRHGGGQAWLLVEDEPDAVTVTVRDAGPGIAPGRLEQAARDGRLGVAQSIRGRVTDLGGTVDVVSDGHGTEVELHVPRPR